jgi:hypothetical protein
MIVHGCIEIHPKDCGGWIIVTGFRVLLISQHLFLEILLEAGIRCPCRKCQNKKYLHPDVVMMHLLHKGFMENYQCLYAHGEVCVSESERRMEEKVVGSTSSASNVHEEANDNTNPYRNMVMDAMRMNQGNVSQCLIVEEEPNGDAARFFDLLKDSDKPLWDDCTNHSKLSAVAQVFTIKSDHGLSEAGYDKIIEWARSILPEGNKAERELLCCEVHDETPQFRIPKN